MSSMFGSGKTYTNDEIVAMVNAAATQIVRAACIGASALEAGSAKANLDALSDTDRGYVKTAPASGQYPVIALERTATGKAKVVYDDVPIP